MLHLDVFNLFVQVFMKDVIHASPQSPLYTGHLMDDPLLSLDNADTTMAVEKITTIQNIRLQTALYVMYIISFQYWK